jgi:hypothetical protein
MSNTIASKTYATFTSKEKRIETTAMLPNGMQLRLATFRDFHGNLHTTASAALVEDGFVKFRMGRDYMRTLERAKVRMTKGNVEARHNKYLESLDQFALEAANYYGYTIVKFGA